MSVFVVLWLAVGCSRAFAADRARVDVSVIDEVSAGTTFVWQEQGDGPVVCVGATCSMYAGLGSAVGSGGHAGVLKLQFPDGKIVVAECVGAAACSMPSETYKVQAIFEGASVKVFAVPLAVDARHGVAGETYRVRGVLTPRGGAVRREVAAGSGVAGTGSVPVARPVVSAKSVAVAAGGVGGAQSGSRPVRCLISTEPMEAQIYVDGERAGTSPAEVYWDGRAGDKHTITVQKIGWAPVEQTVRQGDHDMNVKLSLLASGGQ